MSTKGIFSEKLSNLLFLEVKKETIYEIFHVNVEQNLSMPLKAERIVNNVQKGEDFKQIDLTLFIEGMFYLLGADANFKYNEIYKEILIKKPESINFIKGEIYRQVKNRIYDEAYIYLKGLSAIESNKENYSKLLTLIDNLRLKNSLYKDEELDIILNAEKIEGFAEPHLYKAIIKKEEEDYDGAIASLNCYLSKNGEETQEIVQLMKELKNLRAYSKGKELIQDEPVEALKNLLPLLDEFNENVQLYYDIALAYRILKNHEKAIYYLYEALKIDNELIEAGNELGINYACLGEYEKALQYFKKAFEVTKSIEICTNIIMCYYNMNDIVQAKIHLELAKSISSKDEIILKLEKIINNNQK